MVYCIAAALNAWVSGACISLCISVSLFGRVAGSLHSHTGSMDMCAYIDFAFRPEREKQRERYDGWQSAIISAGWRQLMKTCKCMKATAVRNINSRGDNSVIVCHRVCVCVWLRVGGCTVHMFIYFFTYIHPYIPGCVSLCMYASPFICMYSNMGICSCVFRMVMCVELCARACVCVRAWIYSVDVQHSSSSLYIPLEGQPPHENNRGPNRAQSLNARVCHSAPGLPPSPHCSYAALCSAVSLTGKWWEVTAKDSPVLSHSLGIESPCKVAAWPRTHTHTHVLRQPDVNFHRQPCVRAGPRNQTLAGAPMLWSYC